MPPGKSSSQIYFVGIGGIGMSALARYFKSHGYAVSGSDTTKSLITDSLRKDAINVKFGHKRGNISRNLLFLVYNRAIPSNNPELLEAKRLGVPILPYAEVVGRLTEQHVTIAITGSHGKSTTTALAGLTLAKAGVDPTILVGTNLKELGNRNIRMGKSRYLVLEADDFGAAFLEYSPSASIVTNIDKEHLDFYKTFGGVKKAFLKFIARTLDGGILILNKDDRVLFSLRSQIAKIAKRKKLRVTWYSTRGTMRTTLGRVMKIPGEHNLSNAMAVYELGKFLRIPKKKILNAIGAYKGSWRRMEYRGQVKIHKATLDIYDDYAHHPTEIKATLKGFKEKFAKIPVICVFQPHQTKRLQALFREFVSAFVGADLLILIPSYKVAGRDESNSKFTSENLARAIAKKYPKQNLLYVANPKRLRAILEELSIPSSVLVMMGAGDIVQYTDFLIK